MNKEYSFFKFKFSNFCVHYLDDISMLVPGSQGTQGVPGSQGTHAVDSLSVRTRYFSFNRFFSLFIKGLVSRCISVLSGSLSLIFLIIFPIWCAGLWLSI